MQTIICLFLIFTVSVAQDGSIQIYNNLKSYDMNNSPTESYPPPHPFEFGYHLNDTLNMHIILKNKPKNVFADVRLIYAKGMNKMQEKEDFFKIRCVLKESKISILINLNRCNRKEIVKAYTTQNNSKYYDICLEPEPCVVVLDLSKELCSVPDMSTNTPRASTYVTLSPKGNINKEREKERRKEETTPHKIRTEIDTNNKVTEPSEPSRSKVLIYVIPSVTVMCVIILVVYMRVKKHYHRDLQPEGTIELNTYATANEVLYADLSLAHDNNPPPKRDETPYAQIIGVMKPVPSCKLRNK